MKVPPGVEAYVAIHELAHQRVRNHIDEFWELVENYDLDYPTHASWLETHSPKLISAKKTGFGVDSRCFHIHCTHVSRINSPRSRPTVWVGATIRS